MKGLARGAGESPRLQARPCWGSQKHFRSSPEAQGQGQALASGQWLGLQAPGRREQRERVNTRVSLPGDRICLLSQVVFILQIRFT